jgi:hypothetical protein
LRNLKKLGAASNSLAKFKSRFSLEEIKEEQEVLEG